ncbi:Uncharacterized HTH-type transcriptional regulator y4mQ [uncultured Pleomorphomonas sp.]|uniref:Uncharacterized HTH-type transcriptional regulator y4mQ n=1 Tax=uncultured Pleomorphomonas sp. TaxID=442121 RepID=A0A212LGM5_9HYPH|nr:LysR substrate-binding domain-containing protein [uncultured Pleomorphomonas sp.]SCM76539.1 Uncharacterized HTH-type transcriptional regulator y4mQ [uncultured Pleomorphomonas sp.]
MTRNISLSSFRNFESAARNGSFRAAADELGLSPSAISHSIQKLEEELGMTLFVREGRLVHLTIEAETLMRHVSAAFDELWQGIDVVSNRGSGLLRVHSAPSFATQWLVPHLAAFLAENPHIDVRLAAGTDYARFNNDDFDVDIVYGMPRMEGVVVVDLGEETLTPLCSPAIAAEIRAPRDLLGCTLIQSDQKVAGWPEWFKANHEPAPPTPKARFDRSFLSIAAAADGLGIALESTRLAERELASGRLVAPPINGAVTLRDIGHRLVYPRTGARRITVRLFAEWICLHFNARPGEATTSLSQA